MSSTTCDKKIEWRNIAWNPCGMNYCQLTTKFSILRLKNLPPFGVEFARVCHVELEVSMRKKQG
jgi:hypothetical protein